jgi:hypothetical protein
MGALAVGRDALAGRSPFARISHRIGKIGRHRGCDSGRFMETASSTRPTKARRDAF